MDKTKITLKEKIGYGLGDAASSIFWKLFGMYLLFFYTDVFGIEAGIVGTMFLLTRVWDSLFDPIVGLISDRTETKWGKFRPYLLWMAVPFGVIGVLTFTTPDLGTTGKIIYAFVTYSLMMMIYSLINVPYASLLGVISSNPKERTELSSYRMIFAFLGSILALVLIDPLVNFFSGAEENVKLGWSMTTVVFAIIAVVFFLCTFWWTKERIRPIKESQNSLKEDIMDLLKNRPWWILLGAGVSALIFNSIRDGAAVYYFKYYAIAPESFNLGIFGSALSLTTIYLVLGQISNILGILLVTPISNKIGKRQTYLFAMIFATVFSIVFYFLGKDNIAMMLILQIVISACAGSIFPLLWSMYADIADYSEWRTGRRATGLIFSSSSMSQKFGWSIGGALTGWLLAIWGYQANIIQTEEALHGIRLMLSLLPAAGTLLSVLFIYFYPLTELKLKEITSDLDTKRERK
ncbi:MFS transporter [Dysgonomonas sp. Marseille-P4677]|uniref:MFS transporter n=1 Tax=Dysgonomonas sp. Marseille-P4677 TaxID=2364790 RepID=UPI001914496F|nr:MFS transporter [Dysgonomonas sp. Marseille-P4677]MBK5722194.1 MFS transporter [Dysgonomonas sp. Marseille-P4677]